MQAEISFHLIKLGNPCGETSHDRCNEIPLTYILISTKDFYSGFIMPFFRYVTPVFAFNIGIVTVDQY